MNTETIGTWAGEVWNALNENGELNLKQLKKATKLKDKEVFEPSYTSLNKLKSKPTIPQGYDVSSYIDDINIQISALLSPFLILSKFVNKLSLMIF